MPENTFCVFQYVALPPPHRLDPRVSMAQWTDGSRSPNSTCGCSRDTGSGCALQTILANSSCTNAMRTRGCRIVRQASPSRCPPYPT
eukprot:1603604-Pleurochrysis_carterae.AAC.1